MEPGDEKDFISLNEIRVHLPENVKDPYDIFGSTEMLRNHRELNWDKCTQTLYGMRWK